MTRATIRKQSAPRGGRSPRRRSADRPQTLDAFLEQQLDQDSLRFITCGSVDDGKSTLIGRLLWESQQLFEDQLATLEKESKRFGTQGDDIDFALLVDGLAAEREQGITIDVAYRFFATAKRKFIVADTPGHEQYTRNMVTGASTAEVAILLIDARLGVVTQTRRHAFLASLMGIRHVALAVNKMDLVAFNPEVFQRIRSTFDDFSGALGFDSVTPIPVSALRGDNIVERSPSTPWYKGPTLLGYLETVPVEAPGSDSLVFPVQWVNRPDATFRGFSGSVARGVVRPGDTVRVTSSGQTAVVSEIVTMDGPRAVAQAGDAVTLRLDREIDASRGDVMSMADAPLQMSDQFEATIVWLHEDDGLTGRSCDLKLATQSCAASITRIKYRIGVESLTHEASSALRLNDISVCNLSLSRPIVFDRYDRCKTLGGFILVDRLTHATVGAGLIRHSLRRATNVHRQALSITRADRERLNGHPGRVFWLTGLSGSGKSTIANALEIELHARGMRTYILDGDNVRQGLNRDLGFTEGDRVENIRRIAEVARLMLDAGLVVITAFISPFARERDMARELIGEAQFLEVYVNASLEICEARDVKGLYRQARAGRIPNMTGINSPYEAPAAPAYVAETGTRTVDAIVKDLAALVS